VGERLWFFNVGLSGRDGTLKRKWQVKTLETLLKENKHVDVSKRFLILIFVQLICDARDVLKGVKGSKLEATLRVSRPGVQSASLIMTSLMTS